ncbi:preprotein translocase subunit SecA [Criibacterium bergeronii]|uniref:Protein translocase subunit SecA n=1 Tax=Criibacterium bergeronii TaxID=1871336 RepID=A0A371INB7_9FIRM|nr:preprotein translocase subunit SecA [Criibacterium bergeronii]MBS6062585.1 preprotein translocase subunit SecA [Peptostreptococcaceae bacterium]RDY21940.1 preprotein translocase subunit SecA [Criibacterium bergeronii]
MGFLENVFAKKEIGKLQKIVNSINSLEDSMIKLSDKELVGKTDEFKKRLSEGQTLDDLLPEAFAVCREASKRVLNMRHFDVQLMGGIVLHQGRIAEMKTGEGKTLVATLPVYLNALTGKGVHVITVNDYLATRDMEWMSRLYNFLGLTTGVIVHDLKDEERRQNYLADITYGTNNEFGFDYLRDNMVTYKEKMVQRPLNYAIVDEVDSILIDEARTPLIISGQGDKSTTLYTQADTFIKTLKEEVDYTVDEKENASVLTDEGLEKAQKFFGVENMTDLENMELYHNVNQALRANTLMKLDVDYVVKDGEIVIVDEFTGRLMFGRRYSEGLHQAIEAKEGLEVQRESKTLATITFQNYFRMYNKISGMTGTAKTEEEEFRAIYKMDVVQIPTNRPIQRKDLNDVVYKTEEGKFVAVVNEIKERHATGQPVLVGTISIENSEKLSDILRRQGIKHEVLNAKNHKKEAEIVAQAGRFGQVTIATNMAGRGTDIILGGNPDFLADKEMAKLEYTPEMINNAKSFAQTDDPEILDARKKYQEILAQKKEELKDENQKVLDAGGLCILGTERHESRRIDNQLRGRAGRQGDPGASKFYISLEDDLMRLFGSERMQAMVEKLGMDDSVPIEAGMLSKSIESAQKKVEGKNFSIRKSVLEYDDVMNKQREIIYGERRRVLEGENIRDEIIHMTETQIKKILDNNIGEGQSSEEWNFEEINDRIKRLLKLEDYYVFASEKDMEKEDLYNIIIKYAKEKYHAKEEKIGDETMREIERMIMLQVVDAKWMDHIDAMDQLRKGIGLRAIGQENPVRAYQIEGFDMFDAMVDSIQEDTVTYVYGFEIRPMDGNQIVRKSVVDTDHLKSNVTDVDVEKVKTPIKKDEKVGRNDPCPCGSGKKYKNCCGR